MNKIQLAAARQKFKYIQKLNSEVFSVIHDLSDEEWQLFLESEYVWPVKSVSPKDTKLK